MLRADVLHFLVLILFTTNSYFCIAKTISVQQCDELPSCGDIHNISYPFRLKGQPEECGEPNYELACENNKTVIIYIRGVRYDVQSLDRENLTIRLVDSLVQRDNCSSLPHPLNFTAAYSFSYELDKLIKDQLFYVDYYNRKNSKVIFLSCEKPLSNSSLFIDTKPCINGSVLSTKELGKHYSYVTTEDAEVSDLEESCSIDLVAMSAKPVDCGSNCSYLEFHDSLAYGFELSWDVIACQKYCNGKTCYLGDGGNTIYQCGANDCGFLCHIDWIDLLYYVISGLYYLTLYGIVPMLMLRFVIGVIICFGLLIYKWRRRHLSLYDAVEDFLRSQHNLGPIKYSFSDLKNMTKSFKDKLGEGGYGSVYKGTLRSGRDVAVKVLGKSKANGQEFINEVATIGRIHHVNVVRLIGFCAERSKRALVYEFMPNGSLEKHIFRRDPEESTLSFEQMYKISIGVARGIEYLHRGCDMRILHFDIKPHNILLDENFTPKVSDFGLAKLYPVDGSIATLTAARGTIGYMAPELFYKNLGSVSYKADVYSFGMLLLEMTGKRRNLNANAENTSQIYFPTWVYDQISRGKSLGIEDAAGDEIVLVRKMVVIGLWCIQTRPNDRPSMNRVIEMLESEIESLEIPPKPSLYLEDVTIEVAEHETNTTPSSVLSRDSTESSSLVLNANY